MTAKQILTGDPCSLILSEFVSQKEHVYLAVKDKVHSRPKTKTITPEMDLPSTDSGHWIADARAWKITVPAPEGWECNWHTTWDGVPTDTYPEPLTKKNMRRISFFARIYWRMKSRGERFWRPLVKKKPKNTKVTVDCFSQGN